MADGRSEQTRDEYLGSRDLAHWSSRLGRWVVRVTLAMARRGRRFVEAHNLPYVVLFAIATIGFAGTAVLTAASAEIYDDVAESDGITGLDRPVLDEVIGWRSESRDEAVTFFTDLGSTSVLPYVALAATGMLAWWWRKLTPVWLMAIAATGSVLMTVIGKQLVGRPRPDQTLAVPPFESSPSFPSGHTLNSWVVVLMVAYLVVLRLDSFGWRVVVGASSVVLAVAMGLSRVYLGHHWLTDVLVAWTLGTAWLLVVITAHRLLITVIRHQRAVGGAEGS